ncbi:MAG: SUMF1/EgtB/PvdO family nonheme iron enzyme [Chloracidobacterium sp.]|nr:SUMF1/EgtB/PvdO family nonheme iron enzyme [Chloracidobacterium sp.]
MKIIHSTSQLIEYLQEARARLLNLVDDLDDERMIGPRLAIVNPLRWEIAHVAYFQEFWLLRHLRGFDAIRPAPHLDPDKLYDSARVAHGARWDLPLPSKRETIAYTNRILERVIEETLKGGDLRDAGGYDESYFLELALLHEDMHSEAITYTRQTLGCGDRRQWSHKSDFDVETERLGDAQIPGGKFILGSEDDSGFVFDNERRAHEVVVKPFSISRTAVTQGEFAEFVNDAGYRRLELWSDKGWFWREGAGADHPVYWRSAGRDKWERRVFDQWVSLEPDQPVIHVNWYEAEAYCRWAKRRLPTEAEWEMAASCEPADGGGVSSRKRKYPWGDAPPTTERANLDWRAARSVAVNALPAGDSAFGVRQMIGNVWEWTATDFGPYHGFTAGPYKEYSEPWFGDHKVLRGGCWATRSRLIRNNYRNFYKPDRRDVWAGLRTCAL